MKASLILCLMASSVLARSHSTPALSASPQSSLPGSYTPSSTPKRRTASTPLPSAKVSASSTAIGSGNNSGSFSLNDDEAFGCRVDTKPNWTAAVFGIAWLEDEVKRLKADRQSGQVCKLLSNNNQMSATASVYTCVYEDSLHWKLTLDPSSSRAQVSDLGFYDKKSGISGTDCLIAKQFR
ncbi:hypothetical protein PYCC9005_002044 [Savitreella phatthalungensis]